MEQAEAARTRGICEVLGQQRLPSWAELPDLELYMDQVLSLIARYLQTFPGADDKGLTASMVNNYVKHGVMPPPVRKKYGREHLACLIMICVLKPVLPISTIRQLIETGRGSQSEQALYDRFCEQFASGCRAAAQSLLPAEEDRTAVFCRAALRARAEQALALCLAPEGDELPGI